MSTYTGLSLDKDTHDVTWKDGSLVMVTDAAALAQRIKQHLKFFQGEAFLNTSVGVPYFQYVFVDPFDQATAEAVIKDAILSVPGVVRITAFGAIFYRKTREFRVYELKVLSDFDEVVTANV